MSKPVHEMWLAIQCKKSALCKHKQRAIRTLSLLVQLPLTHPADAGASTLAVDPAIFAACPVAAGAVGRGDQKSQSSSSVATALPITYDEPEPEKKSWFSFALGLSAAMMAGFTWHMSSGNMGSKPRLLSALLAL